MADGDESQRACGAAVMSPAAILAWRQRFELTQTQAGALLGVPLRTWQKWEYGERAVSPPVERLLRLVADYPWLIAPLAKL